MKREIFEEYLGDVDSELLLQNLTNTNGTARANIDCVREMFPHGFTVEGYFEMSLLETETERNEYQNAVEHRMAQATSGEEQLAALVPPDKKLVRLVLEPKTRHDE
jgi:inactivated superfamily I helicase